MFVDDMKFALSPIFINSEQVGFSTKQIPSNKGFSQVDTLTKTKPNSSIDNASPFARTPKEGIASDLGVNQNELSSNNGQNEIEKSLIKALISHNYSFILV